MPGRSDRAPSHAIELPNAEIAISVLFFDVQCPKDSVDVLFSRSFRDVEFEGTFSVRFHFTHACHELTFPEGKGYGNVLPLTGPPLFDTSDKPDRRTLRRIKKKSLPLLIPRQATPVTRLTVIHTSGLKSVD